MDIWSYTILFAAVAASWIGIPFVGGVVLAAAGVLAGNGQLEVWLVILVAAVAAWAGGYVGYTLGGRVRDVLSRSGRWQRQRERALSRGQEFYRRWGALAVFLTPTWVSGAMRMPKNQFLFWNAVAAVISSLTAVFGAYAIASAILGQLSAWRWMVLAAAGLATAVVAGFAIQRWRSPP